MALEDTDLTVDELKRYVDHEKDTDDDLLARMLRSALRFCERYCDVVLEDPVDEDVADAIYTCAARHYRERDAAWSDSVQPFEEGPILSYFRGLPAQVKMTYDLLRGVTRPKVYSIRTPSRDLECET